MSVSSSFFSVEWSQVPSLPQDGEELAEALWEGLAAVPPWAGEVIFGDQVDESLFESWRLCFTFSDWFIGAKQRLNSKAVQDFTKLFESVGLLHTDEYTIEAIIEDFPRDNGWLTAAIPPPGVCELLKLARSIDLAAIDQEFQKEFANNPSEDFPEGFPVADWIRALTDGLSGVANLDRGMIFGAE